MTNTHRSLLGVALLGLLLPISLLADDQLKGTIEPPNRREMAFDLIRMYRNSSASALFRKYGDQGGAIRLGLGLGYNRSTRNTIEEGNFTNIDSIPSEFTSPSYTSFNNISIGWQMNHQVSNNFWWYWGADLQIGASFWKTHQHFFGTRYQSSDSTFYISNININTSTNTALSLGVSGVLGATYVIAKRFSFSIEMNTGSAFFPSLGLSRYTDEDYKKTYNWNLTKKTFESPEPASVVKEKGSNYGVNIRPVVRVDFGFFF